MHQKGYSYFLVTLELQKQSYMHTSLNVFMKYAAMCCYHDIRQVASYYHYHNS